jgi:hypothetical protein
MDPNIRKKLHKLAQTKPIRYINLSYPRFMPD